MINGAYHIRTYIDYNALLNNEKGDYMSSCLESLEINGFKIVEYLGKDDKRVLRVKVICKACSKPFITGYYTLDRIKGCGCNRPTQLKPLAEYINGFRTVKCLGYDTIKGKRRAIVECKVCKREYEADPNYLKHRKHCGCMRRGQIACKYAKSHPQLAQTFKHMKGRCYNKNNQDYYNYGARGITVCDEWLADRNIFCEWSIKNGFIEGLTIDRIDNNRGYEPKNCRWVPMSEQGKNTRRVLKYRESV